MPRPNKGFRLTYGKPKGYKHRQWYLYWYERGTRRERASGITDSKALEAAEDWHKDFVAEQRRPDRALSPERVSVADVLDIYGREKGSQAADPARIGYAIDGLLTYWHDKTVAEVKESTCREYLEKRARAVGTMRRELGCLSTALEYCRKEGYVTSAPNVWMPEAPQGRDRWLTRAEAAAMLREARKEKKARLHLPTFILLGLYTGARTEAILSLQWLPSTTGGYVDLDQGRIDFNPIGRRETKKRRALIPIPPQLLIHLRQVRKRTVRYVVEFDGEPVKSVRRSFGTAASNAKVQGVNRHTLRHTACTWFMHRGVSVWDAAGWVRMSVETFTRRYAHHHPDYMKGALESFRK